MVYLPYFPEWETYMMLPIFTRLDYKRAVKYIFSQVKYNILPLFWKIFKYDYKLDSYRENIVSVLYLPIGYSKCTSDADIFPRAAPSEKYNASSVHLEHPQGRYNTSKIFARYDTSYIIGIFNVVWYKMSHKTGKSKWSAFLRQSVKCQSIWND